MKTEIATEFEPIRVLGVNQKRAQDLIRDTERPDHSLRLSCVALDLSVQPPNDWIRIFVRDWSLRLSREVAAQGEFNITEKDEARRRIQMQDANDLTRRIFDARQAGVPGFSNDKTIFWSLEVVQPFGGLTAYVARVLELIDATNLAYPFDTGVIAGREKANRETAQKDARRAEAETILATVQSALGG